MNHNTRQQNYGQHQNLQESLEQAEELYDVKVVSPDQLSRSPGTDSKEPYNSEESQEYRSHKEGPRYDKWVLSEGGEMKTDTSLEELTAFLDKEEWREDRESLGRELVPDGGKVEEQKMRDVQHVHEDYWSEEGPGGAPM